MGFQAHPLISIRGTVKRLFYMKILDNRSFVALIIIAQLVPEFILALIIGFIAMVAAISPLAVTITKFSLHREAPLISYDNRPRLVCIPE